MKDLYRVETVLSAMTVGPGYGWSENHLIAHGWSGQRNPLGHALNRLLDCSTSGNVWLAEYLLAGQLCKQKVCRGKDSVDLARDALKYWRDPWCRTCKGTGVLNIEQERCDDCDGTGRKFRPASYEGALKVIEAAQEWMEDQLRGRLRRY